MIVETALRRIASFGAVAASVAVCVLGVAVSVAHAQEFPDRPIQLVVPLPPGGSVDALGRELATQLSKQWKQSVVVDNKPGASNIIGAGFVARAPKDGYTALLGVSGLASLPTLYRKLPFDIERDFVPVSLVAQMPFVIVVPASSPAKSLPELVALAKGNPAKFTYGSYGNGTAPHLAAAKLASQAGIDLVHVPYKGSAPALTDLVAGRLSLMIMDIGPIMPYVKAGKLKALNPGCGATKRAAGSASSFPAALQPLSWTSITASLRPFWPARKSRGTFSIWACRPRRARRRSWPSG
jgi:tripartite-type tricarboxylate transporter receptor subunit TctC